MIREILFRGKRVDNGKWEQGYLFCFWEKSYILWGTTNDVPNMIEVIPETVGQFTGLIDKNDKRIFESDIFLATFKTPFTVVWDNNNSRFIGNQRNDGSRHFSASENYILYLSETREVIGNIHDCEEL